MRLIEWPSGSKKRIYESCQYFTIFILFLLEKYVVINFIKLSLSPKSALCQVWLHVVLEKGFFEVVNVFTTWLFYRLGHIFWTDLECFSNQRMLCVKLFRWVTQVTYCYGLASVVVHRPSSVNIFSSENTRPKLECSRCRGRRPKIVNFMTSHPSKGKVIWG